MNGVLQLLLFAKQWPSSSWLLGLQWWNDMQSYSTLWCGFWLLSWCFWYQAWVGGVDRWGLEVSIVISAVPAMCSVYHAGQSFLGHAGQGRGIAGLQGSGVF